MSNISSSMPDWVLFLGLLFVICFFFFILFYIPAYHKGKADGYIECLDDIRLNKTPRYKLVRTAEKWVKVDR